MSTPVPIGIVGFGTMGAGIAQVAARAGHQVLAFDAIEGMVRLGIEAVRSRLERSVERGRLDGGEARAILDRLTPCSTLADLAPAGLVVEAVVEDLATKRRLFVELENIVSGDCILTSNTSSLSIAAIAAGLRSPERVVGMHFFNPAPLMALVEVVSGLGSGDRAVEQVCDLARAWGKTPVKVKSAPGFIVNRVARPFYGEALRLLAEGAAAASTIDAIMREGGGFPMGPFELLDLVGIDVSLAVSESVFAGMSFDPRFSPSPIQRELVAAGRLGRKSGWGFYDYRDRREPPPAETVTPQPPPRRVVVLGDLGPAEALIPALAGAGIAVERRPAARGCLLVDGLRLEPTEGCTATERAAAESADLAVFDLMLDYGGPGRVAVAVADQADPAALASAAGLLQAAGKQVSAVDDTPGLIVMRTVAMLANFGCDAVHQGVCDAAAVDLAMKSGAGYPRGPLEWADSIGPSRLVAVLDNLAWGYGEDRYRVSPLLRRRALSGSSLAG